MFNCLALPDVMVTCKRVTLDVFEIAVKLAKNWVTNLRNDPQF